MPDRVTEQDGARQSTFVMWGICHHVTMAPSTAGSRTDPMSDDNRWWLLRALLPVLPAFALPLIGGVLAWPLTGEWRWTPTGVIAALTLPVIVIAIYLIIAEEDDLFAAIIWILVLLAALGVPVGLAQWLWTSDATWGLLALLSPLLAVFVGFAAMMAESDYYDRR
jgi:hypothetical protein